MRNIKYFIGRLLWDIKYLLINIKRGCFSFRGRKIRYFNQLYNQAGLNERTIEIPITYNIIRKYTGKNILEIGNVLSHYFKANWDILDKYEKGKEVINEDIVDFRPRKRYSLIFSISTFEHIGYDEKDKDDNKVVDAINHVKTNLLTTDGLFIITIPLGYNSSIDKKLLNEELKFNKIYYFRRISADNRWQECKKENIVKTKYGSPYGWANAIAICATKDLD